jgi:acetyltransferase-like isoleucine patch superfamily enzyme
VVSYQSFTGGNASCNGFYAGSAQNVTVPSGANCTLLPGTTISQDVTVQPGGSLSCQGASIGHDLQAQKPVGITVNSCQIGHDLQVQGITGASAAGGDNYVCSSSIGHDVQIQNGAASASPFDIGDPPSCSSGNQVGHDLVVQNNAEPVDVSDNGTAANPIGHDLTVQNNKPGGATVSNNHAGHDATCQQNSPQAGAGNSAQHNNSCPA